MATEINRRSFPSALQEQQFFAHADRVAARIIFPFFSDTSFKEEKDADNRRIVFEKLFGARKTEVENSKFIAGAQQADADTAVAKYASQVKAQIEDDSFYELVPRESVAALAETAILGIYKTTFTDLGSTGLAFAGYGDREYFPRMEVHRCSGMVLGKLFSAKDSDATIGQKNVSDLVPLATSEMMGTFIWGISDSLFYQITEGFTKQVNALLSSLREAGHLNGNLDATDFVTKAKEAYTGNLVDELQSSHQAPLKRVIASLPFSEMAELAESLVFMESMKERVTAPSESVSGPIDVAVISKGDGFIWIKRKHYFDPKLNPRFFSRHS